MLFDVWDHFSNTLRGMGFLDDGIERLSQHFGLIGKIVVTKVNKNSYLVEVTGQDDVEIKPDMAIGYVAQWMIHYQVRLEIMRAMIEHTDRMHGE